MSVARRAARGRAVALRVDAAAKVNLVLRVGPLRADGYHDLATLLVPIDLSDQVAVRLRRGVRGEVTCRVPGRPELDGAANLAARAAEGFRARFGIDDAVEITIRKRIPVVAGLGGGSSDAAAVLRALARAYRITDRTALAAIALDIGSDVPFFLERGAAWATSRGERLTPARVPRLDLVVLYPRDSALAIRAGDAYRWLDAARQGALPPGRPSIPRGGAWRPSLTANDLQDPCFGRYSRLRELQSYLEVHGASPAIMSGSGPTVFGVFANRATARRVATGARRRIGSGVEVHVARTLHRHPGVTPWKSPRSASSRSQKRNSRPT